MLNPKQLAALRATPAAGANKLSMALGLVGYTQTQFALELGLTQGTVSKIARGEFPKLPIETARKCAEFFGCSMEDLFPAKDERQVVNS